MYSTLTSACMGLEAHRQHLLGLFRSGGLQTSQTLFTDAEHLQWIANIWKDSLIFPSYAAGLSLIVLIVNFARSYKSLVSSCNKRSHVRHTSGGSLCSEEVLVEHSTVSHRLRKLLGQLGGLAVVSLTLITLLSCLVLLCLSIVTAVMIKNGNDDHASSKSPTLLLQLGQCITYAYASLLAFISTIGTRNMSKLAARHLTAILLCAWAIYMYRDLWPLATYSLTPADAAEGGLLWAKVTVLTIGALVVPLLVPRRYNPVDPKDPMVEPNSEQTASVLSLVLYNWLDKVIYTANRNVHLPFEELPALADYDYAKNLVKRSFMYLDPFQAKADHHIFWSFMKVFKTEALVMALTIVTEVIVSFMSPLSVNRLLVYMETDGEGATIRPWIWIATMFFGPLIVSVATQWTLFLSMTKVVVPAQAIVTELVLEHALRIRIKADITNTPEDTNEVLIALTSENASLAESSNACDVDPEDADIDTAIGDASLKGKQKSTAVTVNEVSTKKCGKIPTPESSHNIGRINNLVTSDLLNITDGSTFLPFFVLEIPLNIGLSMCFLYAILGWSAFVGFLAMVLLFPLPAYLGHTLQGVEVEKMKSTDARVQSATETINVIRMVKLFGWERLAAKQLSERRETELKKIRKSKLLGLSVNLINYCIPTITMIATFVTYTIVMRQQLTASRVFSSMAVFDILRMQLYSISYMVPALIKAKVSLDRISDFLFKTELLDEFSNASDVSSQSLVPKHDISDDVLGLRQACFTWVIDSEPSTTPGGTRKRIFALQIEDELIFQRGRINLIVGPTGSGKTSLLMALLGEMHYRPSGPESFFNLPRSGGVAYAAQEYWVQNETIRDNILFGAPYDEHRYKKVVEQCALERDLSLFEAGDNTEVGEKGITLSGGQKARVTLARAVYSSAETLLLDDVLAALDIHTSSWIIKKCFQGDLMRGRTVILVTHNVALAGPISDFIVSLGPGGRILSQGTFSKTLQEDQKLFAEVAKEGGERAKQEHEGNSISTEGELKEGDGKLVVAEEIEEGHVSWTAFKLYLANLGERPLLFWFIFMLALVTTHVLLNLQTWALGYWASQYEKHPASEVSVSFYLTVYTLVTLFGIVVYASGYLVFTLSSLKASRVIHTRLVASVLGTTLRWLDKTPMSRIIARCTGDIQAVDDQIANNTFALAEGTVYMLLKVVAVTVMTPIFVIPAAIVGVLGGLYAQVYMKAQLPVKREMSNARAPVLGHIGTVIAGLTSIRAYGAQNAFKEESLRRIDRYTRTATTLFNLNRWVTIRADLIGTMFSVGLAAYLTYGARLNASNMGFSLAMAAAFSAFILEWVRTANRFEVSGNSLERIQQYLVIEQEAKPSKDGVPPTWWPASGDLRVERLSVRYSPDGPEILHNISFEVKSGERIGIVGRTGSGKSSLTLSLLRCILTEGEVYYDGKRTDAINLDELRSKITIIPQVPELLSGTLRQNLDPYNQHDDAVLNDALGSAGLFSLQNETGHACITLDSEISSGGSNLSVGERQIIALARAIVRQSKLLILDEATSSIDYKTDAIIQTSLRNELRKDITLLTVAHRLQTIMDADKILVLDAGRIIEFDTPSELLKNEKGMLRALVDESGDRAALCAMANGTSAS